MGSKTIEKCNLLVTQLLDKAREVYMLPEVKITLLLVGFLMKGKQPFFICIMEESL